MILKDKCQFKGEINRIKYIDELIDWLDALGISMNEVCLSGSAILAYYGIRENNDLEVILDSSGKKKLISGELKKTGYWGHIAVSEHVDFFNNQYAVIGYADKYIFAHKAYIECNGFRIIDIGYEYLYKKFLLRYLHGRKKDIEDIDMIEDGYLSEKDIPDNRYKDKAGGLYYVLIGIRIHMLCIRMRRIRGKIRAYVTTVPYWLRKLANYWKDAIHRG